MRNLVLQKYICIFILCYRIFQICIWRKLSVLNIIFIDYKLQYKRIKYHIYRLQVHSTDLNVLIDLYTIIEIEL